MQKLVDRFLAYVKIDTQSDPNSDTNPSTKKQWDLALKLVQELKQIGLTEVSIDDKAYVMATLPSNMDKEIPTIGFISHFDTTPDFSGTHVEPQIIEQYDGADIVLNKEQGIVLSPDYFDDLKLYIGQTLITTNGTTLLGADDKAGIAEIVTAMEFLINHPEIKHGKIRVAFTPDEEIGRGAHHFDVGKFAAEWAYTIDGSQVGELEYENFNAAGARVTISGKSVHPGYAKEKMVNAIGIANEFISHLPSKESPEHTSGREGFFHVHHMEGKIEQSRIELIIRDHDMDNFTLRKDFLKEIVEKLNEIHGDCVQLGY